VQVDGAIAFVFAMPMEAKPLVKALGLRKEAGGWTGTLDGQPVIAVVTGMGPPLASAGIATLLASGRPARVVVVGITGAVDDTTPIGTIVNPARVVDAATGRSHDHHPLGPEPGTGVMWTTDRITPAAELPALIAQGVVSLDMETAAIAQGCEVAGVPWSVVRVISDRASDGSVDDEVFRMSNQDGTPNPRAVARYLLKHPGRIPGLAKMGGQARKATITAVDAAIAQVRAATRGS
jgi:adenosylhomocysteine nucleosidase